MTTWLGIAGDIGAAVRRETQQCLAAYEAKPNLVDQDSGIEISSVEGGYGRKQLHELLQNGADAMVTHPGRIAVVLTERALYCANEGSPLTQTGLSALMASHISTKRNEQIGRFGLGFKSVLGISDSPAVFSRSGSVRFDRRTAENRIRLVAPSAALTPVLRVAEPVDPAAAAALDPTLAELMTWATTVIRLDLKSDTQWLHKEMADFPPEFLLFTEHVTGLDFDDRAAGLRRSWQAQRDGTRVELVDGDVAVGWRVFSLPHRPTPLAMLDAGQIAGRELITVSWAVPDKGRASTGSFWASFPTNSRTTLSGIINAPFKTTEDRHDILKGAYNEEILDTVLPTLVAANFHTLVDPDDPGSVLEILPARGREARSWADDYLNDPVMAAVAAGTCIPDQEGVPRRPREVHLSPPFLADHSRWSELWSSVPDRPSDWIDGSIDARADRRAKAVRLYEIAKVPPGTTEGWLESLAGGSVRGSMVAVQLGDLINRVEGEYISAVRRAKIVLCADGKLRAPTVGKVFLPDAADPVDQPEYVSRALVADVATAEALAALGLHPLDAIGRLSRQCERTKGPAVRGPDIERLWDLVRQVSTADAVHTLETSFGRGATPVRTRAAKPQPIGRCLLPGTIVRADGVDDDSYTVDPQFHATDQQTLAALGAVTGPRVVRGEPKEEWFEQWRNHARDVVVDRAKANGVTLARSSVVVRAGATVAHLGLLPLLSDSARAAMTKEVLLTHPQPWVAQSEARNAPAAVRIDNPAVWWVRQHGMVSTSLGVLNISEAVRPFDGVPADLLPVPLHLDDTALDLLGVRPTVDGAWWARFLTMMLQHAEATDVQRLYAPAARAGVKVPTRLKVADGENGHWAETEDVYVTDDLATAALLRATYDVCLVSSAVDAATLRSMWSLQDAASLLQSSVLRAPSGEPEAVVDHFPGLRAVAAPPTCTAMLVPCTDLALEVVTEDGTRSTSDQSFALEEGTLFYLDSASDQALLVAVNDRLRLNLDERGIRQILEIGRRREQTGLTRKVRSTDSVDDKLLALAGEKELRKLIPSEAIDVAERRRHRKLTPSEVAGMARTTAGTQLFKQLRPSLEARGVEVPALMNGGAAATEFTANLGLPEEMAGSHAAGLEATMTVHGPLRLPVLHPYQSDTIVRVRRLLRGEGGHFRGLVALPTGSGKTRVAVESIVDHIREENSGALVVWIAQSNELCEQAVETWSHVWRAVGSHQTELTVNRLWASNQATRASSGAQVIVATDDKLISLSTQERYDWLRSATVVVVDEAHTSVSKTYTALFNWLERGTRQRDKPLLGLSATPYRGTNEEQTKQLVNRYDGNLLTDGLFGEEDPYTYLQNIGVLARVKHVELEGMTLTPLTNRLSDDGEDGDGLWGKRVDLDEVTNDGDRNDRIIDSLLKLSRRDGSTTALVFAASVRHAEILAAVLNNEGVPSAAVSTYTAPAERRELVRKFKTGEVRVLTNYNVLSQGFDAPRVGAVYVARPTFSLNRYQQMIGRGLRGPRNNGSAEVMIVNVRDNIDAFGENLAFHHFDALWQGR